MTAHDDVPQPAPDLAVVWHEHHFPAGFHDDEGEEVDEVTGRYDALEYADGRCAAWSAQARRVVSWHASRDEADRAAARLASGQTPMPRLS